ncbi:uncharacterized protein [Medicago truncatula]|uniref:uncharacterized protein n=1 Tax=Medicago truncatula TaxID=3880 RepID=UPI000D2F1A02|nr:uncharacterized protein LOC112419454 [Medicago truncatula]
MIVALGSTNKHRVVRHVRWYPPPEGCIKVNVDGSSFGIPGDAAIWRGLQRAWDLGYRSIILESDSQTALDLIADTKENNFHPHATLLSLIRKFISLHWVVFFTHTLREGNECADWLVKLGDTNADSLKIWTTPPPQLDIILLEDIFGALRQ